MNQVGSWGSKCLEFIDVHFLLNSLGRLTHGITAGLVNHTSWGSNPDGVKSLIQHRELRHAAQGVELGWLLWS